jgi:hypothetical protein
LKEIPSYASAERGLRLQLIGADTEEVHAPDDQVRKDVIAVAHDPVSVPRETIEPRFRLPGIVVEEFDELPWVSHRERLEHQPAHESKDRGVGADAEGKGEDGDRRKSRRLSQRAETIAGILN